MQLELVQITNTNIEQYMYWQSEKHDYQAFNGPYFDKENEEQIRSKKQAFLDEIRKDGQLLHKRFICIDHSEIVGQVSYYWRSIETDWLEIGIAIYEKQHWSKGFGRKALTLWINHVFDQFPQIVRIGLSTWSGNHGMIKLAEKLGLYQEACYKKARIVKGKYYDSVSYGILREEWTKLKNEGSLHSPH